MNVVIIELGGSHMENVYTLVHLLHKRGCSVSLVINEKLLPLVYDRSAIGSIKTVPDNLAGFYTQLKVFTGLRSFLKKENIEAVIIGTTEIKPVRTLVFFLPVKNITGIVHDAVKLEKGSTLKNILSLRMHKFLVFGDYVLKQLKPLSKYRVSSLDAIYFPPVKELKVKKPNGAYWIIIPGSVIEDRRDYLPLIEELSQSSLPGNIKLIFLGYFPSSEASTNINSALTKWQGSKEMVITFSNYLDYDLFHSYIAQADVIVPLMKMHDDQFYGDKRTSGALHLGLGYKKPFLLPATFKNDTVASFSIYYSSMKELVRNIISLANDNSALSSIKERYAMDQSTDLEKQSLKLMEFIRS